MDKDLSARKRIGIIFTGDYSWAGGLYYVLNIIKSLEFLDESSKPFLVVYFNDSTPKELLQEIKYPFVKFRHINESNPILRFFFRVYRKLFNRNLQLEKAFNSEGLSAIFPLSEYYSDLKKVDPTIYYWLYDFQHKFLPQFFSQIEIQNRDKNFESIAKSAKQIVVSSHDAHNHFKSFFAQSKAIVHVLQFVSFVDIDNVNLLKETVREKYQLNSPFFLISNQFWAHKNHMLVLNAIKTLSVNGLKLKYVFTGNLADKRNPGYIKDIYKFIDENKLEDQVVFTGFIDRQEQLCIMSESLAVIQPSRFEGWSTVVEDAKALNKLILLSDIPVHREQNPDQVYYFGVDDVNGLSSLIQKIFLNRGMDLSQKPNEKADMHIKFANAFIKMFN